MLVGDLAVRLVADIASLRTSFEQATDHANKFGTGVSDAVGVAKGALAALGVGLSVGLFVNAIKESIDFADKLNDLSKQTGISVETIGGLGYAAQQSGTDLDTVVKAAGKLSKQMAEAATGNKEAAASFDALKVKYKDGEDALRSVDSVMFDLADKFAAMEDGPAKAALAMQYFGKSGAELIPLLNEGGDKLRAMVEEYQKYGGVSKETAAAADQFNDTMAKLNLMSGAFTKELTAALLPVFQAVANIFLEAKENGTGFKGAIEAIVTVFKVVVNAGLAVYETIRSIIISVKAVGEVVGAVLAGDFEKAAAINARANEELASNWKRTGEQMSSVWQASAADIVTTANNTGPKVSAPLVKAAKDTADEFKKMLAEMALIQAADAAGLAPGTVKQLGDLGALLDAGKIKWDDYNKLLGLILDKDPLLKAEQEKLNKAIADGAAEVDKQKAAWDKETGALDDRITQQNNANTTFGLGKSALIALQKAQTDDQLATELATHGWSAYAVQLEAVSIRLGQLGQSVQMGEALETQRRNLEDSTKAWNKAMDDAGQAVGGFLHDWMDVGFTAAVKKAWSSFVSNALDAFAQLATKTVLVNIVGAISGGAAGGAGAGGIGGALGGASDLFGGIGQALGIPSLTEMFSGLSFAAADFTSLLSSGVGVMDAFSMASASAGLGLTSLIPVVGGIAAAGYALYSFLESKKGGPKEGGFATSGATPGITGTDSSGTRWFTPNSSDGEMAKAVTGLQATFDKLVAAFGGTSTATFAQGFSTDPKGSAASNVHTGVFTGSGQVFDAANGNVGRSPEELKAELETQSMRAILAALQASQLPDVVGGYLRSIDVSTATVEQIQAALAHAAELSVLVEAVAALPADMADGLLSALGQSDELDQKIADFATQFKAFSDASALLSDQLDRDPAAEVRALSEAQSTNYEKVLKLRDGLGEAVLAYDGTTEGTRKLTDQTKAYVDAQVAALLQIEQLKTGLAGMFGDSIKQLDWAVLDTAQRGKFLMDEATKTMGLLQTATDPTEIEKFARLIDKDLVDAFNLLSPEEQKVQHDAFVANLKNTDALVQARLEASRQDISADNANAQSVLGDIRTAMDAAADKQQAAAQALIDAAAVIKAAAATHASAAATIATSATTNQAAANTQAAAADVALAAANTPIQVEVSQNTGP